MKRRILISLILINLCIFGIRAYSQPDPSNGNGGSPVGGGAPLGSGLVSLLVCGVSYLLYKTYKMNRKPK